MRTVLAMAMAGVVAGCATAPDPGLADPARVAGWRGDLALTREGFLARDLSYSPTARAEAEARLTALEDDIARLDDIEISGELARIAALSENAHTRAYVLRNRGWWRRWPVRVWRFENGWRVVAGQGEGEGLVGGRIVSIDGVAPDAAAAEARDLFAGNDAWAEYMAAYTLTSPDAMRLAGVSQADGAGRWIVVMDDGRRVAADLAPMAAPSPQAPRQSPEEAWWFLSPAHPATEGWTHALGGRDDLPVHLRAPQANYLMRRCDGGLYVQYFRAQNAADERTLDFGQRVMAEIAATDPARVVVDVRYNTGGDLTQAAPFFEALALSPVGQAGDRLMVISGVATFSAALHPIAMMRQRARPVVVGQGPGEVLDWWAEGGNTALPYSGLTMHHADRMHAYSRAEPGVERRLVHTDFDIDAYGMERPMAWTWADYVAGRDPSLGAALGSESCGEALAP